MDHRATTTSVTLVLTGLLVLASAPRCSAGVVPDVGITYGPPLRLSAYGDLWLAGRHWVPSIGAQVGAGGSSFSIGLARTASDDSAGGLFAYSGLRAAVTFTGKSPLHALPRSTYAGLRGEIGLVWVAKLSVGVDMRIGDGRRDTRFVCGISASPILPAFLAVFVASGAHYPGVE